VAHDTRHRFTYFSVLMPLANPSGPTSQTFVVLFRRELSLLSHQDLRSKCEA